MLSKLKLHLKQLFQRSKSQWFRKDDTNYNYMLLLEGWIEGVHEIRQEIVKHFSGIFRNQILIDLVLMVLSFVLFRKTIRLF